MLKPGCQSSRMPTFQLLKIQFKHFLFWFVSFPKEKSPSNWDGSLCFHQRRSQVLMHLVDWIWSSRVHPKVDLAICYPLDAPEDPPRLLAGWPLARGGSLPQDISSRIAETTEKDRVNSSSPHCSPLSFDCFTLGAPFTNTGRPE